MEDFFRGSCLTGSPVSLVAGGYLVCRHLSIMFSSATTFVPRGRRAPPAPPTERANLHTQLQQLTKAAGLADRVRINKSLCLDQCEHGPTVVVYPDAVWYGFVRPEDAAEIVEEHLVGGRPVERLRLAEGCINTKTCPHREQAGTGTKV